MKKIGFVDFYISEWHANNYPAWFKEANEKLGLDYEVAYFWAEQDISPVDNVSSSEWAEKMGIKQLDTLEELCEKSDVIVLLAPSTPEKHLPYAEVVLSYGKRTYIDKTFAPNLKEAQKIFDIAKKYNTPFFTTSALRYAEELKEFTDVKNLVITGGGRLFEEYLIHNAEMAVALLKKRIVKVKTEKMGKQYFCRALTDEGNEIGIVFSQGLGYSITAENSKGELLHKDITSSFFLNLISDMLKFFEDGKTPFDNNETIEVMRLRAGLIEAANHDGEWLEV
ncbi:MAG: hypothetical protein E7537_01990 [Ruminococcaceae bacterium]|nr:hypothetical protein [Oscillospiraceae bacterium]